MPTRLCHCAAFSKCRAMMWLNRRFAAAAARESHICVLHARTDFGSARGARERAVCEPSRRFSVDSTASLCSVSETLHHDAGRIDVPRTQRLANCTIAPSMRAP
eukprot:11188273-Lingulodinium_polyedra.AAC.1